MACAYHSSTPFMLTALRTRLLLDICICMARTARIGQLATSSEAGLFLCLVTCRIKLGTTHAAMVTPCSTFVSGQNTAQIDAAQRDNGCRGLEDKLPRGIASVTISQNDD